MTQKQLRQDMILLMVAVVVVLVLGALLFSVLEGWHLIDAFYFVTMTATTVGYGDLTPTTQLSKVITILFAVSIVPFVLYAFSAVAKSQMQRVYTKVHQLERKQKQQEVEISKAERKLKRQKTLIKQQEGEIDKQQSSVKKQLKAIKEHDKEIEAQKRKIREQAKVNKRQASEIKANEEELEAVENIMEKELTK